MTQTYNYQSICEALSRKISINGALIAARSTETLSIPNPATLETIGTIALCSDEDLTLAITAAEKAQADWKKKGAPERGKLVRACGDILKANAEELAQIMSYETGKAIQTESRPELGVIADTFYYYAGLALELKGETIPYSPNMLTMTLREPLGVVGAIIPWNVPLMLMSMKICPALVAGNTVVLKASPEANFCVLRAAELMNKILPAGVFNVITGGVETGKKLVAHPKIKKITFTGSVDSGRQVYQSAAANIIPVTLELGGKSPLIICEDAELDKVVDGAYDAMRFTRQGQSCSAATRFLVHDALHDRFIEKLLQKLDSKVIGDPMDDKTEIGTIISKRQFDKVQNFVTAAQADRSLKVHQSGKLPTDARFAKGLFFKPTLVSGLTNSNDLCQKEVFGPVAAILKWSRFEDAMAMANDVEFGLAAGIWTRDLSRALQAVQALEAGFVQVNQYMVFRPSMPFGGFKHSGIGKEASLKSMLDHYTREKTVLINMLG